MMRVLMILDVTTEQLSAAIDNFANSPFPMDIHGEIALAAMYGERDRRRQNAPEFLVKVVDPCETGLDTREFSKEQECWIEQVTLIQRELAKQQLRVAAAAQSAGNAASVASQENEAFATMNKNFSLAWARAPL